MLLPPGDSLLGGSDRGFNNGRLTLIVVIIGFCGLVVTGTALLSRVSVVWREGT